MDPPAGLPGGRTVCHLLDHAGQRDVGRCRLQPRLVVHLRAGVHGSPGADQGVAAPQVQAEPRRLQARDHRVQPEGDLGQFDGGGVEVYPVHLVQRDGGLDPLQFSRVRVWVDPLPKFGLAAAQVLLGKLPDGLDGERSGTERRLADVSLRISSAVVVWPSWSSSSARAWETVKRVSTSGV